MTIKKKSRGMKSPWPMACCAVVCAIGSMLLLTTPQTSDTGSPARAQPSPSSGQSDSRTAQASASQPTSTASSVELPPRGEGRAADPQIQALLERTWPRDLPVRTERDLLVAGRAVLIADVTGIGRKNWPQLFDQDRAVAPAFSRVRIQAAIARHGSDPDEAVVHLVWAGADRGGTYSDGRITDITFTRTENKQKGDAVWTPLPS
ncbi:hypothetical protein [Streptomyces sp. N35]|uniref:hypothetical protein n=1 Tax=Streptomyces sp. N35 TaxID=2795730 RepID=UPI0027DB1E0B|nr:hypothetical protein [Streptomyces sp. N35]